MDTEQTREERLRDVAEQLTKDLAKAGKLVEAGWLSYRAMCVPYDAGEVQLTETHRAFFAGCQHIWGSVMTMMDSDREPTLDDMQKMEAINRELQAFVEQLKADVRRPPPSTPTQ